MSEPGKPNRNNAALVAECIGGRIPVWMKFSKPVQTGPGAHASSFEKGIGSLSRP